MQKNGVKLEYGKPNLGIVITKQFPNAIKALAQCSEYGHLKYAETDKDWLNFKRIENPVESYTNAMFRHVIEETNFVCDNESGLPHIFHTAWNAMARLEVYLDDLNKKG